MTITKTIINLLEGSSGLIAEEIYVLLINSNISVKKENLWSYLSTLRKNLKIDVINDKKPYKYVVAMSKLELLSFMNEFFKNNIEYLMKNPETDKFIEQNEDIFNKIEEMINNAKLG